MNPAIEFAQNDNIKDKDNVMKDCAVNSLDRAQNSKEESLKTHYSHSAGKKGLSAAQLMLQKSSNVVNFQNESLTLEMGSRNQEVISTCNENSKDNVNCADNHPNVVNTGNCAVISSNLNKLIPESESIHKMTGSKGISTFDSTSNGYSDAAHSKTEACYNILNNINCAEIRNKNVLIQPKVINCVDNHSKVVNAENCTGSNLNKLITKSESNDVNCAGIINPNMLNGSGMHEGTCDNQSDVVNAGKNCTMISINHKKLIPDPNILNGSGNLSTWDNNSKEESCADIIKPNLNMGINSGSGYDNKLDRA